MFSLDASEAPTVDQDFAIRIFPREDQTMRLIEGTI